MKLRLAIDVESITALMTWLFVALSALILMHQDARFSPVTVAMSGGLYLTHILLWLAASRKITYTYDAFTRGALILLQLMVIVVIYWLVPYTFSAILAVLTCSLLPFIMPFRAALIASPLFAVPMALVFTFHWDMQGAWISAALFWTFNVFALVMINAMLKERAAAESLSIAHQELIATQSLLTAATQQSERVRIARNIHDLLGHHLTALTIKLQVAGHLTDGEAKTQIDECHQLAKLLLSDVREAVSEIREKSTIDLHHALAAIASATPRLAVDINVNDNLQVQQVDTAEAILRSVQESITNSLKHSNARTLKVRLGLSSANTLQLDIQDDGTSSSAHFLAGNGLKGMQERVFTLGGNISLNKAQNGFSCSIQLPLSAAAGES